MLTNTNNVDRYVINTTPLATYSISFPYWDKSEIVVYLTLEDGSLETLVENTNYTLSTPDGNNGTLTRVGDWTSGATNVTIVRKMSLTQEVDLRNGDKIDAETIETALDNLTAQVQQLAETQTRAVGTSVDEAGVDLTIPSSAERAGSGSGTIMGFGPTGNTVVLRDLAEFDQDVSDTASNATTASNAKTAAESARDLAQEWASKFDSNNPSNTQPVADGNYSAKKYAYDANASEAEATEMRYYAEGYANGTQDGVDVGSSSRYYHNNAKYWKNQADQTVTAAQTTIDNYVDNTSKPAIDSYVENTTKPAIDSYESAKETELNNYTTTKKTELNNLTTSNKTVLDNYTTTKKSEIDYRVNNVNIPAIQSAGDAEIADITSHTTAKKTELDNYVANTSKPAIDSYVENTSKPAIDTYVTGTAEPAIDTYVTGTAEPAIDTYINDVKKPEIDAYITTQEGVLGTTVAEHTTKISALESLTGVFSWETDDDGDEILCIDV